MRFNDNMNITLPPQTSHTRNSSVQRSNTPSFTSNFMRIGTGQRPHFTYFFRGDLEWRSFAKYLHRHFANADKVNVYNAACSDGTEPFTLVMSLISKLGQKKAQKFFPIEACDLNKYLVNDAKTGQIPLLPDPYTVVDIFKLKIKNLFLEHRFLSYKKVRKIGDDVQMKDETRKHINIYVGNVLSKVDEMKGENSVVMSRNMWMYLDEFEQELLAHKLGQQLKKDSVVVLGKYDIQNSNAVKLLSKNGFEETYIDNVFEKMK